MSCRSASRPPRGRWCWPRRADVTGFFPEPAPQQRGATWLVNASIFEGLTRHDPDHRIEPALAVRWENPDERTYVVETQGRAALLGRPPVLCARDVAASLLAPARHGLAHARLPALDRGRRRSRATACPRCARAPDLVLLTKLPWGYVIPAEAVDAKPVPAGGHGALSPAVLDAGPRVLVLARNAHYRGPAPAFAKRRGS